MAGAIRERWGNGGVEGIKRYEVEPFVGGTYVRGLWERGRVQHKYSVSLRRLQSGHSIHSRGSRQQDPPVMLILWHDG